MIDNGCIICNSGDDLEPNLLLKIFSCEVPAVIIKGFLNANDIGEILDGLKNTTGKKSLPNGQGIVFPPTIYSRIEIDNTKEYYQQNKYFNENFANIYGVDVKDKLFKTLAMMAPFKISEVSNAERSYPIVTFRELYPGYGEMTLHCEKELRAFAQNFYLANNYLHFEQLSFYIMLQQPEVGGQLELYNVKHSNTEEKLSDEQIKLKSGIIHRIADLPEISLPTLEQGSLIVFNGGELWHRVEKNIGDKVRITLGGFIGMDAEEATLYVWS